MKRFRMGGLFLLSAGAALCLASEPPELPGSFTAEPLGGGLWSRPDERSEWTRVEPGRTSQSSWLRTDAGGQAVVSFASDTQLRLAGATTLHMHSSNKDAVQLQVVTGKIFASVPPSGKSSLRVSTPDGQVQSSGGEFLVNVVGRNTELSVLDGRAALIGTKIEMEHVGALAGVGQVNVRPGMDARLAYDGPDVRQRNKARRKFEKGEQNTGKRLNEDQTPTPSPSPSETPAPASVQPPTQPPPANNPPPQLTEGGGSIWPWVLGGLGLGTGLYFLLRDMDDNEQTTFIQNQQVPASP